MVFISPDHSRDPGYFVSGGLRDRVWGLVGLPLGCFLQASLLPLKPKSFRVSPSDSTGPSGDVC